MRSRYSALFPVTPSYRGSSFLLTSGVRFVKPCAVTNEDSRYEIGLVKIWSNFRIPVHSIYVCRCPLKNEEYNNKHLMTGPEGNSEFCFPRISMFHETKSRGTLRFEGNKIHCSPRDQSLSDLLYSKTKRKQILNNALRFQQQRSTFRG